MARKIVWNGIEEPASDLCVKMLEGYYDVVCGEDGWRVHTPYAVHSYDGNTSTWNTGRSTNGRPATREEARIYAEYLINHYGLP
jgi:hypothetical protein